MSSTSAKQAKFMRAVAHSPKFAKKVGVSQSVGKDFEMADKRKKMKKFSEGGEAARSAKINKRYDRKVADIDSDYKKALAKGKNADVAKAKYEQRMADAADDRAKWTGGDRTQTRAAESAAEKNLSMTRKYGARSSDTQVAKAESKLEDKAPLSSVDTSVIKAKPTAGQSFAAAFRAARNDPAAMKAGKFTWNGKSYSTKMAGEGPSRLTASKPAAKTAAKSEVKTEVKSAPAKINPPASLALASKGKNTPTPADVRARAAANLDKSAAAKRNAEKSNFQDRLFNWLGRGSDADARSAAMYRSQNEREQKYKAAVAAREAQGYKKGGKMKKFNKGGSTTDPRRAVLGSDKDIIGRGNRTPYEPIPKTGPDKPKSKPLGRAGKAGFKSGGSVMKKGADGVAKKGKTHTKMPKMACGGKMKGYAKGGSIDGIAVKGKTRCKGAK